MATHKRLTDRAIETAKPANLHSRYEIWDAIVPALALRVTDKGAKSFNVVHRVAGKLRRWTIGKHPALSLVDARKKARAMLDDIARGVDPDITAERERIAELRRQGGTFTIVAADFIERYAKKQNRGWRETERIFSKYVAPTWGAMTIGEITRLHVAELLDRVEDQNGPVMADRTLAAIRKLFNWQAARDDSFSSPVVHGMARTKPNERARRRTLSEDELRDLWPIWTAEKSAFGALMQFLLLTGQRREEAAKIRRSDLSTVKIGKQDVTVWTIAASNYKTKRDQVVPLSAAALAILDERPVIGKAGLYFTTTGRTPFAGYSKAKARCDVAAKVEGATIHDLRRTAKTMMTRAGVPHFNADRVLGHAIAGVGGVYDRHDYLAEKRDALVILAAAIEGVLNEPPENVVQIKTKRKPAT